MSLPGFCWAYAFCATAQLQHLPFDLLRFFAEAATFQQVVVEKGTSLAGFQNSCEFSKA